MYRKVAMGSWSGTRKYLEQDRLARSLRGRVQYICPNDRSCGLFEVRVDRRVVSRFSVVGDALASGCAVTGENRNAEWGRYWDKYKDLPPGEKAECSDMDFAYALCEYRLLPIGDALASENPVIRMFAILDRRVGKRTLERLRDDAARQPEWLRELYLLRFDAEGIALGQGG